MFKNIIVKNQYDTKLSFFLFKTMYVCFSISMISLIFVFFDSERATKYFFNGVICYLFLGYIRNMLIIKNRTKQETLLKNNN